MICVYVQFFPLFFKKSVTNYIKYIYTIYTENMRVCPDFFIIPIIHLNNFFYNNNCMCHSNR